MHHQSSATWLSCLQQSGARDDAGDHGDDDDAPVSERIFILPTYLYPTFLVTVCLPFIPHKHGPFHWVLLKEPCNNDNHHHPPWLVLTCSLKTKRLKSCRRAIKCRLCTNTHNIIIMYRQILIYSHWFESPLWFIEKEILLHLCHSSNLLKKWNTHSS